MWARSKAAGLVAVLIGACSSEGPEEEPPAEPMTAGPSDDGSGPSDDGSGDGTIDADGFMPEPGWDRWEVRAPGYAVPVADTTYVCFGVTLTVTELRHVVAFEPVIDQAAVVHHMIVYQSEDRLDELEPCYPGPPSAIMQWGWGPGGQPLVVPEQAGFPIGRQPGLVHFVLQIHYDNAAGQEGVVDHSGIDVYTTRNLREHEAGIFQLGDVASLVIPPGQERWPTVFSCSSEATALLMQEPISVFGSWLHAHRLGRALWTEQFRDGEMLRELGRHDPYDFANQRFEPLDATIEPGDRLVTHCDFDSTGETEPVHGGGNTDDEMCLNYLMYYPAQPWLSICNDG